MKSFDIKSYQDAGCTMLAVQKDNASMAAVHAITGGKLCDTGCAAYHGGKCAAFQRMTRSLPTQATYTETVKQEAARLGVSVSEVRRRRNPSTVSA